VVCVIITGQVLAWGFNADGELGNDSTQDSDVPVMAGLPQDTMATEVSAGCNHSLALTSSGHVLAWGRNDDGELGNASTVSSEVPVQVNLPATVTPLATGAGPVANVSFAIVHKAQAAIAYDAATGNVVLFGGSTRRNAVPGGTWTWG
jgi:hypothetical protein